MTLTLEAKMTLISAINYVRISVLQQLPEVAQILVKNLWILIFGSWF